MFQVALLPSHHNPVLKPFADRLRKAGKPHKVIITAVARKLVTIANALCKSFCRKTCQPAGKCKCAGPEFQQAPRCLVRSQILDRAAKRSF